VWHTLSLTMGLSLGPLLASGFRPRFVGVFGFSRFIVLWFYRFWCCLWRHLN